MNPPTSTSIKTTLIVLTCIIILTILLYSSIYLLSPNLTNDNNNSNSNLEEQNQTYVSRIIDGDTFELSDNSTVRLICIDAPEKGATGYDEAKQYLSNMILDKQVRLEKDINDKDDYGRLLRYVYVNISGVEFFVNKQLVQEGFAKVFRYGNDTSLCGEISGG